MSGTVCTIFAVQISAPCSPCMNWLKRQASKCRRTSPALLRSILSHHGVPKIGMISSGMPTGLSGSTSQRPVEAVAADPLAAGALVVEPQQLVAPVRCSRSRTWWSPGLGDLPVVLTGVDRVDAHGVHLLCAPRRGCRDPTTAGQSVLGERPPTAPTPGGVPCSDRGSWGAHGSGRGDHAGDDRRRHG